MHPTLVNRRGMTASGSLPKQSRDLPVPRREFSRLLVGLLIATPRVAVAQGPTSVRRIGLLGVAVPSTPVQMLEPLRLLRELGWIEGQNLHVEHRYASSIEMLQPLAEELVRAKVEVILANGPNPTRAAMRATTSIPIVFLVASDPVLSGLVASLARPGGNVTGFSVQSADLNAKLLSLLRELLPRLQTIGMLETSANPQFRLLRGRFEQSCRALNIEPVFVTITAAGEIEAAVAQLAFQRAQALILSTDSFALAHAPKIIDAALERGLPTVSTTPYFTRKLGALASYSPAPGEAADRAAYYINRILRGTRPADLPVEQPRQFEFVINLKTARRLGLAVPRALLLSANELVE